MRAKEMKPMPDIAAFLSYVLVTTFTPGPNNIMSMSNAARYGFRKSISFNFGVTAGFFVLISLCSLFSFSLVTMIPAFKPFLSYIGAAYILWLAWKTFTDKPHEKETVEKGQTNTFMSGFLLQFVNPKAILYGLTTTSVFIIPYYDSVLILGIFSLLLALTAFVATSSWSLFGSVFQKAMTQNYKLINSIMALLLVYCAISLFH